MIFRQLYDAESSTYTYLLGDPESHSAVLIDPVLEQVSRDLQLISELDLKLTHVLETHVHADHITGGGTLRDKTGAQVVASKGGASCANRKVEHEQEIAVGALTFKALSTPGHTDESLSYLLGERVFTGDALLIRGTGRTDFQNGDAGRLYDSITRVLFALPDETRVYPAHDYRGQTMSTIGEEKRHNPRIAGKDRQTFIELMKALDLPKPKKIDLAVPANRACGQAPPEVQGG